jgi:hypothetical protein
VSEEGWDGELWNGEQSQRRRVYREARSEEREELTCNPSRINELSQEVDGVVTSASVVPTGLWVSGASVPSDDEDS